MKHLISPNDLLALQPNGNISVVDCRFSLSDPGEGRRQYLESHIPGAVYLSLDDNLSAPIGAHGGRHPLPSIEDMSALFGQIGITRGKTTVVVYDDSRAGFAARLWWMLRYIGHDDVRVLDGGFAAWKAAGGRDTREIPAIQPVTFIPEIRSSMRVDVDTVRNMGDRSRLVDCRAEERYRGEVEPIDIKAGRIPGAVNIPWQSNTDDEGRFLPMEELRAKYASVPDSPIMYCGSGVTACVDVLAFEEATGKSAVLYPGSFSDWISYDENPVDMGM